MNLYRISQDVNNDYETYDKAVVVAPNEAAARKIHPGGMQNWENKDNRWAPTSEDVMVLYLGEASADVIYPEVICASFNW